MDKRASQTQYPIPTTLNLLIIVAQLIAIGAIFYGAAAASAWWHVLLLAVAMGVLGNSIYSIIHEAEHRVLHPNPRVNDVLGVAMALLFPAPFHLIRQGHLGHHMRNRSDDEAFDFYFDGENSVWKWLQLYGILTGFYWMMVVFSNVVVLLTPFAFKKKLFAFDRPSAAFMESLNPRYWWLIRFEAAGVIALHAFIIWSLDIALLHYVAVYYGFGLSWSAMQYVHHFGTERHVLDGTRNLWISRSLDLIWLNHNWHLNHHRHPTVPWIYLPRLEHNDKAHATFLLWHYLKMWRGPRYTDEHVENKYAGRIMH